MFWGVCVCVCVCVCVSSLIMCILFCPDSLSVRLITASASVPVTFVHCAEQSAVCFITLSSERGWQVQIGRPHQKNPEGMDKKNSQRKRTKGTLVLGFVSEAGGLFVFPARYFSLISTIPSFFPLFFCTASLFLMQLVTFHISFFLPLSVCTFCLFHSLLFCLSNATHFMCVCVLKRHSGDSPGIHQQKHCYCSNPVSHIVVLARQDACWSHQHN